MPGPGELPARQPAPIIGREAALARLRGLVDPVPQASQVLIVTGEAGMGKTALLADAAEQARWRACGCCRSPAGNRSPNSRSPGCTSFCGRCCPASPRLPGRQAQALLGALGLVADPDAADPLLTGIAVFTLLSDLSEHSPVLVVADDAHWLDRSSLDALALRRQPSGRRAGCAAGGRPGTGPAGRL